MNLLHFFSIIIMNLNIMNSHQIIMLIIHYQIVLNLMNLRIYYLIYSDFLFFIFIFFIFITLVLIVLFHATAF